MNSTKTLKSIIVVLLFALGFSLYYINSLKIDQKESLCVDYSQYNPSTLQTGLIGDMVSIYEREHLTAINTKQRNDRFDPSYNGSESITFDLDTIQKFIYHIKKGVLKNSLSAQNEKLGLRIYYAAYPEKSTWGIGGYEDLNGFLGNPITEKYEKKHTLVIIPVRKNNKDEVVDFNPFDLITYESGLTRYLRPEELIGTTERDNEAQAQVNVMAMTESSSDNTIARNHGGLYPPHSNSIMGFKK